MGMIGEEVGQGHAWALKVACKIFLRYCEELKAVQYTVGYTSA
jgi:hypothetical protein